MYPNLSTSMSGIALDTVAALTNIFWKVPHEFGALGAPPKYNRSLSRMISLVPEANDPTSLVIPFAEALVADPG